MTKIKKIDNFDKRILDLLILDSKISLRDLAKKLKRNKGFINYRLKNLLSSGIIERMYPLIDIPKLGFIPFDLFIRTNMNEDIEKEFILSIKNKGNIYYIERLVGNFSLRISFFAKFLDEANKFVQDILEGYYNKIEDVNLKIVKSMTKTKNILFTNSRAGGSIKFFERQDKIALSQKELNLLKLLNKNPRISILEISEHTGYSRDYIKKTIKKLEKQKIIRKYCTDIDIEQIGLISKLFIIKLKLMSEKDFDNFINNLLLCREVQTITVYFPKDFISLELILEGNTKLRNLQIKLLNEFHDYIENINVLDYYDEPKYSYMDDFLESISS